VIRDIVPVLKSDCRWKDEPVDYGPHKTLYNRFVHWRKNYLAAVRIATLIAYWL
jgi:transposase